MEESSEETANRVATLLGRRQELTDALGESPYDLFLYIQRALVHSDLGYPDLAAGDAYRALLLTDEIRNDGYEYHQRAVDTLMRYSEKSFPDVLNYGRLSSGSGP